MSLLSKVTSGIAFLFIVFSSAEAAVTLTSFGTSAFIVDDENTGFNKPIPQTGSSVQIVGSDQNGALSGGFASGGVASNIDITNNSSILTLTGSTTSAPSSLFNILLFDSTGKKATYTGGSWTTLTGGSTTLSFSSSASGFNFSSIAGMTLLAAGSGSPINATLTGLSAGVAAAPEPSRAVLGMLGLGFVALRRRRR
jgi:MYXO-CTERM domain-containing protein